jgi:fatty-acyl-CoA synthase
MDALADQAAARHASGRAGPAQTWARALANIAKLRGRPELTLPALVDDLAARFGDRPALVSEHAALTYRQLAARKARFAHWALAQRLARGDVVCLLMGNCPDYIAMWLGASQSGATVALINTNLRGAALAQAIDASGAALVVTDPGHAPFLDAVRPDLARDPVCWCLDAALAASGMRHLEIAAYPDIAIPVQARADDIALLVFTSGTTGMPKAARITQYRVLEWSFWFAGMMDTRAEDRLYNCLPLYHSTGGIASIGGVLVHGGAVILRERFSVSRFWDDVASQRCTLFLYIGELCRYLVQAPPHPREASHHLRLCCGNGLRADVWAEFVARFRIPQILEFYASTEGNVSLYNVEGRPGAIGRIPPVLRHRFPVALIDIDPKTGEVRRDAAGWCIRSTQGEAIGKITTASKPDPNSFDGYADHAATEQKILRHVFAQGDAWFRTGDLMRVDAAGFFSFVDRLGDTFRWKGENVSAVQVEDALCRYPGISGAAVYGVAVPGHEGRAGMAAITVTADFDPTQLHDFLARDLPPYARPLFLRICAVLEMTGTFKPVKAKLANDGFMQTHDPLLHLIDGRYDLRKEALLF